MENTQTTENKRKSQFPVAIAYFVTLLVCLGIFGLLGKYIINHYVNLDIGKNTNQNQGLDVPTAEDRMTILYVQVGNSGQLNHALLVKLLPDVCEIKIVPISNKMMSAENDSDNLDELGNIYANKGVVGVKNAVEQTLGVDVDKYMTVTDSAFDNVVDYIGGVTVAPSEDIFYTDPDSGEQIACKKGTSMSLDNTYTRLYVNYPNFSQGAMQNVSVLGDVMTRFINEMFLQADNLTNNMDAFFNVIYNSSDTNMTKSEYLSSKKGITYIIQNGDMPCESMAPSGEWSSGVLFVDDGFSKSLAEFLEGD